MFRNLPVKRGREHWCSKSSPMCSCTTPRLFWIRVDIVAKTVSFCFPNSILIASMLEEVLVWLVLLLQPRTGPPVSSFITSGLVLDLRERWRWASFNSLSKSQCLKFTKFCNWIFEGKRFEYAKARTWFKGKRVHYASIHEYLRRWAPCSASGFEKKRELGKKRCIFCVSSLSVSSRFAFIHSTKHGRIVELWLLEVHICTIILRSSSTLLGRLPGRDAQHGDAAMPICLF